MKYTQIPHAPAIPRLPPTYNKKTFHQIYNFFNQTTNSSIMAFFKSKAYYAIVSSVVLLLHHFSLLGQSQLNVTQVNGVATATFTPLNCSPGVAILYWGDEDQDGTDCISANPGSGVQHQYQACGTYTVTYKCEGIQNPPPPKRQR